MGTKLHSFRFFTPAVIGLLYFVAIHSVALRKECNEDDNDVEKDNDSSSNFQTSSCPCKCNNTKGELDCSNKAQSSLSVQTITGQCGTITNFTTFNFSHSSIQKVSFTVKGGHNRFCSLDFSHNEITKTGRIIFYDCNPVVLDFSNNNLTKLPRPVNVSFSLDFDVPGSTDIKINFSHNQIAFLKNFIRTNLFKLNATEKNVIIDLSYNRIVDLSIPDKLFFVDQPRTQVWTSEKVTIILQNNKISSLKSYPNISGHTKNLGVTHVFIDLRNNSLSSLPNATENIDALSFSLEGNPWNCDCHQKWISNCASKLRQSLNHENSTQPYCHQPENVKNRSLLSLKSDEFVCPPPRRDTVELACPIVGVNPPIESIEWKMWTKSGLPKPFTPVKICHSGNCPLVVNTSTSNWEGIYQCTAYNGINVSSSVNISLSLTLLNKTMNSKSDDLCDKETHLTWLNIILVVSFVIVFSGFVVVSYNHYRGNQKDNSNGGNICTSTPSDVIAYDIVPSYSPPHVTFSTPKERVSSSSEYLEPTNQIAREGGVKCSHNDVSHRRASAHHARKVSIDRSLDGNIQNTDIINHQRTGLDQSKNNNMKRSIVPKSGTPDNDGYEILHNEGYTPLNVVHVYEGHVNYQRLNCPHRSSTQI